MLVIRYVTSMIRLSAALFIASGPPTNSGMPPFISRVSHDNWVSYLLCATKTQLTPFMLNDPGKT